MILTIEQIKSIEELSDNLAAWLRYNNPHLEVTVTAKSLKIKDVIGCANYKVNEVK
jgi:hypothetical protein